MFPFRFKFPACWSNPRLEKINLAIVSVLLPAESGNWARFQVHLVAPGSAVASGCLGAAHRGRVSATTETLANKSPQKFERSSAGIEPALAIFAIDSAVAFASPAKLKTADHRKSSCRYAPPSARRVDSFAIDTPDPS